MQNSPTVSERVWKPTQLAAGITPVLPLSQGDASAERSTGSCQACLTDGVKFSVGLPKVLWDLRQSHHGPSVTLHPYLYGRGSCCSASVLSSLPPLFFIFPGVYRGYTSAFLFLTKIKISLGDRKINCTPTGYSVGGDSFNHLYPSFSLIKL